MALERLEVKLEDLITAGAKDGLLWAYSFLPETYSLPPAEAHKEIWDVCNDPKIRYASIAMYRDGAKTTTFRAIALRRICYAISKTILFVSESFPHAKFSLEWIRDKISNKNSLLYHAFHLEIGEIDNAGRIEIYNPIYQQKINIIPVGITGQIRGLNVGDHRPDYILVDDCLSYEDARSPVMVENANTAFFGAIQNSLAANALNPHAKLINIGTPTVEGDIISKCEQDPQYLTRRYSIFNEKGESAWPAKWTTEQLLRDKESAVARNQLSLWLREKECQIATAEKTLFLPDHLQKYIIVPASRQFFLGIDPVPPPSERQVLEKLENKDEEAHAVIAVSNKRVYIEEIESNKGHEVDWTIDTFVRLVLQYKIFAAGVEAIAYQRTLKNLLEMVKRQRRLLRPLVFAIDDKRKKFYRIQSEIGPFATSSRLYAQESKGYPAIYHQFVNYPGVRFDDRLDSVAIAIMAAKKALGFLDDDTEDKDDDPYLSLTNTPPALPTPGDLCP